MGSKQNFLVVGAGLAGATAARLLADCGHAVTVIDQRSHIGGNAYDYCDSKTGIRIHKYGPHIFHTNNLRVVNFLSRFTEWLPYEHRVSAQLSDGRLVDFPPNQYTSHIVEKSKIVDIFYRPYSEKMWGKPLEEIDSDIINRVKIRDDWDNRYFPNDVFQMMPKNGYTEMFENMLSSPLINIQLNTAYTRSIEKDFDHCFVSMSIDQYYDYTYGILPYRSIQFKEERIPCSVVFPRSVINFTDTGPYTRVTEWKHFPGNPEFTSETILTFEIPCAFEENNYERYYPIKCKENLNLYKKYKNIQNKNITFIGRCGLYVYIDMDQAVNSTMSTVEKYLDRL